MKYVVVVVAGHDQNYIPDVFWFDEKKDASDHLQKLWEEDYNVHLADYDCRVNEEASWHEEDQACLTVDRGEVIVQYFYYVTEVKKAG